MIDINLLRKDPKKVKKACEAKGIKIDIDKFLELDGMRGRLIKEVDDLKAEQNKISKEISSFAKASMEAAETKALVEKSKEIKEKIKELEPNLQNTEKSWKEMFLIIPNFPADDVKVGKDESENEVIRKWGKPTAFKFQPKNYMELAANLDLIDTEQAAKISGTRFGYLKNEAALLEFALVQFTFNTLTNEKILKSIANKVKRGYTPKPFIPIIPPVMIQPDVLEKMARLNPKEERYYIPSDNLYLIGSAEHTLGPLHMDEILEEKNLPIRYVGFSTSFRREAGSYGKDTKGILRVHQFDKIEMESFTTPENSDKEQEFFVAIQEHLMQSLKIPYQVVMICTGDMGGPDYRQIDIEAWLPGQNTYRETHTSDLMTDYQSRRLNTRIKRKGNLEFVHMNDATAFAIGRTLIAIMENYQKKDGTIEVPKVLQKYCGFKIIKRRNSA
jgi:seryl-tRNA synthetase